MINRQKILNHLAQINDPGLTGIGVREFIRTAHTASDQDVIDTVIALQTQIKANRPLLKKVLGGQYDFFNYLKLEQCTSPQLQ